MAKSDWIIIYLSVCLAAMQWQLYRVVKDASYNEGRNSVYAEWAAQPTDGTCYVKKGCR